MPEQIPYEQNTANAPLVQEQPLKVLSWEDLGMSGVDKGMIERQLQERATKQLQPEDPVASQEVPENPLAEAIGFTNDQPQEAHNAREAISASLREGNYADPSLTELATMMRQLAKPGDNPEVL